MRHVPLLSAFAVLVLAGTAVPAQYGFTGTLKSKFAYTLAGSDQPLDFSPEREGVVLDLTTAPEHWSVGVAPGETLGGPTSAPRRGRFAVVTPTGAELDALKDQIRTVCENELSVYIRVRTLKATGFHKTKGGFGSVKSKVTISFTATTQDDVADALPSGKGKFKLKYDGAAVAKR